jgi:hypothetical protein
MLKRVAMAAMADDGDRSAFQPLALPHAVYMRGGGMAGANRRVS